ncbi:hypothetical protein BVY03_01805 [bacterium K02(2017)]|nr:hypothetical protein BVY03_01805 [bacterium K02(2017)]
MELINFIQNKLESIYGIKLGTSANDYLIEHHELSELLPQNQKTSVPKELFLVNPNPQDDTLEIALFLDPELKYNLSQNNPLKILNDSNLSDFCILIEGISHFVYYLHKASLDFEITELEMELQAEIDKFILLTIMTENNNISSKQIIDILFEDYLLHKNLSEEQIERYHTASNLARKYCFTLSKQIKQNTLKDTLKDVRRFYPLTQEQKIKEILN